MSVKLLDVRTPMRDGVELSSDVWLPDREGRHPLILLRTPYLKVSPPTPTPLEMPKLARFFASNGYAVAIQDVRGRGDSDGEYSYYFQEAEDGYDTIEWLAEQTWCNGRVGTMGVSYLGAAQWLAAKEKPPHLICVASAAAPGHFFNELPYVGGAFLQNRLWWCNFVSGRITQTSVIDEEWSSLFDHRPLLTADEVMGRKMPLYREWLEHATLDAYWKRLALSAKDYANIDVPALHITGWFDSNQAGAMYHWHGMTKNSPAARDQFLLVGPWDHAQTYFGGVNKVGQMEFTDDSIVNPYSLHLQFFDRYLKQTRSSFNQPCVRFYVTGRNKWRDFEAYPVPNVTSRRLYLSSHGRANSLRGDGRLVEEVPAQAPPDRYIFDPRNPVPLDPFAPETLYAADRQSLEQRDDILTYSSLPLEQPVEVIGRAWIEVYAASDALDTDFTAALIDLSPDGCAIVLGPKPVGIIRARYRRGYETTELLTPGQIERYEIDVGHLAHAFLPGHSIRVEISSSAAPMYNPNQNTGNPVATDTEWRRASQTIYHDVLHPSALVLPVVAH